VQQTPVEWQIELQITRNAKTCQVLMPQVPIKRCQIDQSCFVGLSLHLGSSGEAGASKEGMAVSPTKARNWSLIHSLVDRREAPKRAPYQMVFTSECFIAQSRLSSVRSRYKAVAAMLRPYSLHAGRPRAVMPGKRLCRADRPDHQGGGS
jgi:hypothetical protein